MLSTFQAAAAALAAKNVHCENTIFLSCRALLCAYLPPGEEEGRGRGKADDSQVSGLASRELSLSLLARDRVCDFLVFRCSLVRIALQCFRTHTLRLKFHQCVFGRKENQESASGRCFWRNFSAMDTQLVVNKNGDYAQQVR